MKRERLPQQNCFNQDYRHEQRKYEGQLDRDDGNPRVDVGTGRR